MKRILIVDDEPFYQKVLQDAFGGSCAMEFAISAEQAITMIEASQNDAARASGKFDLIITDLHLPGMNGLQFAEYVRAKNRLKKYTPIIMLTQFDITKDEARKHGCAAYLPKNDINKVISFVRILLASP